MAVPPVFGLSLCAGAGGLDLGLMLAEPGYRAVCLVERDAYAAAALVARMADEALAPAPIWDDVATFDGRPWRGIVDCVAAGYPCQPESINGKRRSTADERWLWPDIERIIGEVRPRYVFLENVAHHLRLGFPIVARGLCGLGYRVAAGLFTAEEVRAPHRRERLFVLADRDGAIGRHDTEIRSRARQAAADAAGCDAAMADTQSGTRRLHTRPGKSGARTQHADPPGRAVALPASAGHALAGTAAAASEARAGLGRPQRSGERVFPPGPLDHDDWADCLDEWPEVEPAILGSADGMAHRVDRLRLAGNGVVPLVAAYAYRTLRSRLDADHAR